MIALLVFLPWAIRDWVVFGSPLPGQALSNSLSLDGRDIFAWQDRPSVSRYLAAGPATLLGLRLTGLAHNLFNVLLIPAAPVSIVGVAGLSRVIRSQVLRPLLAFAAVTFAIDTVVFPVATTWGTFLHAAGPIHMLLIVSALGILDVLIARIGHLRGWTRPVHWLGPTFAIVGSLAMTIALLPGFGNEARITERRLSALAAALDTTPLRGSSPMFRSGWPRRPRFGRSPSPMKRRRVSSTWPSSSARTYSSWTPRAAGGGPTS